MKEEGIINGFYSGLGPILLKQIPCVSLAVFVVVWFSRCLVRWD
jgi:hypothetical protein